MSALFHSPFTSDPDAVDPGTVPSRTLYTGASMPAIGLGTFGSDHVPALEVASAVIGAAAVGYRHFDCAAVYRNEDLIGESLQAVMSSGISREELWVTSKLWNNSHAPHDVIPACQQSLRDLKLEYLDMYLVHWPFPNHHDPGVDASSRSAAARPYIHESYMETWRELEKLVELGLVRHIGTSNMTIPKLSLVLRDAHIKPAVNEMELHPHFQQQELFDFVRAHAIEPVGYSPLGSPGRPERDKTREDTIDMEDPVILDIAARHSLHPSAVCLKWAVQRGQTPIPFSTKRRNYLSNLQAVVSDPLTTEEMQSIAGTDKNSRLIKGHVFLWKDNQNWEDLWDLDGTITPA
ncbi:MAG: aldo/keto reductase [Chloroflexia bacterium]